MRAEDVAAVARLAEEGFRHRYLFDWRVNAESLLRGSERGAVFAAIAERGGEVAGYANLRAWPAGGWVDQLVVGSGHRRQGCGLALMEALVEAAAERGHWKISLITAASDSAALSFFEACGFDQVGRMKDEIGKGEDGVLMSRIVDHRLHPNQPGRS
jgi:ribosomal-protein-alanine N-acetyltransferase